MNISFVGTFWYSTKGALDNFWSRREKGSVHRTCGAVPALLLPFYFVIVLKPTLVIVFSIFENVEFGRSTGYLFFSSLQSLNIRISFQQWLLLRCFKCHIFSLLLITQILFFFYQESIFWFGNYILPPPLFEAEGYSFPVICQYPIYTSPFLHFFLYIFPIYFPCFYHLPSFFLYLSLF